ncbi:MAG: hypothetical protein Q8Q29_08310 [Actinomycetota bacterium]|nr:hypothetical protein [Actinomycetota bacterium]
MSTCTRALTVSIAPSDGDWSAMRQLLNRMWDGVQRAANAGMREYVKGDTANGTEPRLPKLDGAISKAAYAAARAAAPDVPSGAVSDVMQRVRARYLHDRWKVVVSCRQSVPTYRRPLPYSVRRQNWSLTTTEKGYGAVFAVGELRRDQRPEFGLILRTRRDREIVEAIAEGRYARRTLEILPPGWDRSGKIVAKLVYTMPRPEARGAAGLMPVRTGAESLLIATIGGEPFRWNGDELRELIEAYERRRQRMSEDWKFEGRCPSDHRRERRRAYGLAADKREDRVRTRLQQLAATVTGKARRHGFAGIAYDDRERSFVAPFPWAQFRSILAQRCEAVGLVMEVTTGVDEDGGCPADTPGERATAPVSQATSHADSPRKGSGM